MSPRKKVQQDGESDLAILHPDCDVVIAGKKITVREYRFLESLRLQSAIAPLAARMAEITQPGESLAVEDVNAALADYPELIAQLIATSCDQSPEWVGSLRASDGDALFGAWWKVNSGFFIRCVVQRVVLVSKASAGSMSTLSSSPPDTLAPTSKRVATRNVN